MSASLVCSKVLISGLFYLLKNVVTIIYLEKKKEKTGAVGFRWSTQTLPVWRPIGQPRLIYIL